MFTRSAEPRPPARQNKSISEQREEAKRGQNDVTPVPFQASTKPKPGPFFKSVLNSLMHAQVSLKGTVATAVQPAPRGFSQSFWVLNPADGRNKGHDCRTEEGSRYKTGATRRPGGVSMQPACFRTPRSSNRSSAPMNMEVLRKVDPTLFNPAGKNGPGLKEPSLFHINWCNGALLIYERRCCGEYQRVFYKTRFTGIINTPISSVVHHVLQGVTKINTQPGHNPSYHRER